MTTRFSPALVCILSFLLTACSGAMSASDSAEVDKMFRDYEMGSDNSPQATISKYLATVRAAIVDKMEQPQSYRGKKCSVRLMLQRDGTMDNPQVESGDPVLCAEIMSALKEAKIPPAPDEQTYLVFKNATLDFTL